jgi:hypothetical protein
MAPETPEMKQMRQTVWMRIAALVAVGIMSLVAASNKLNLVRVNPDGWAGTLTLIAGCIGSVHLLSSRDSYLPFLGNAVFPPAVLALKTPSDAAFTATVPAPPGATHVVYWASESAAGVAPAPGDAYGNFGNSGVVAVSSGIANLPLRCPAQYKVNGKTLPRHVHYRVIYPSGIAGPVQSSNVTCL